MLDISLSATVSDQVWDSAAAHTTLSQSAENFFAEQGAVPVAENTRRRYRRVFVRGRGVIVQGDKQYGAYTIDVSPMGIGFFSPIQLFPKQIIALFFEESGIRQLVVRRCVRTGPQCYSCGGDFVEGPMAPGAYRDFLAELSS